MYAPRHRSDVVLERLRALGPRRCVSPPLLGSHRSEDFCAQPLGQLALGALALRFAEREPRVDELDSLALVPLGAYPPRQRGAGRSALFFVERLRCAPLRFLEHHERFAPACLSCDSARSANRRAIDQGRAHPRRDVLRPQPPTRHACVPPRVCSTVVRLHASPAGPGAVRTVGAIGSFQFIGRSKRSGHVAPSIEPAMQGDIGRSLSVFFVRVSR